MDDSRGPGGAARVLLIEDDTHDAMLIAEMLRTTWPEGLVLLHASRLEHATQELLDHGASCVLLGLPLSSGLGSLVFLVFFLPIQFINMLANPLLLIFVGLILHLLAAIAEDATQWGGVKKAGVVGILLGLGIYTHHSTIIYVAASVIVIMLSMPTALRPRLLAVGIILLISGSVWVALPHGIGTKADHAARAEPTQGGATAKYLPEKGTHFLFDPKYSFGEYLVQTPAGFGVFFLPLSSVAAQAALGVVILGTALFFLVRRPDSKLESRHRVFLGFALIAVLGHFAIFNLV